MNDKKIMILDGNSILFKAFYALPPLKNKNGIYTNALYGFLSMLYKLLDEYQPEYICTTFDHKKPTFRHKRFKDYKAGRAQAPNELVMQFALIREILDVHKIRHLEIEGYEADDISGTLAHLASEEDMNVFLVTSDKDYLQLVGEKVNVLLTKKGVTNIALFNQSILFDEYGITPKQFIDLKGLMGDSSDNIPGVKGVGEKTGLKLIKEYGSIDGIYENIEKIQGKLRDKLESEKVQAYMSKELSEIIVDLPLNLTIEELKYKEPDREELLEMYKEYDFRLFMNRVKTDENRQMTLFSDNLSNADKAVTSSVPKAIEEAKVAKIIDNAKKAGELCLKFFYDGERSLYASPIALGIMTREDQIYYIEEDVEAALTNLKPIFEDGAIEKIGHNIKDEIIMLNKYNISLEGIGFDTMIAKYLLEPSETSYDINRLVYEYHNTDMQTEKDFLGSGVKKISYKELEKNQRKEYMSNYLKGIWSIKSPMEIQLMETDMDNLFKDVELPLVKIMASMEILGFKINTDELKRIGEKLSQKISVLELVIQEMAGLEFNINSPKQLGKVLFEELNLPIIKKTKTGYSTDVEVLEKLKNQHPIIQKLIEYRQLTKLNSTYVEGLLNVVDKETGRVHSSFKQTIASTGRISSTDPNLQNIPVKTDEGRELRKIFVHEDDYILIDADYSQIELRVLAHLSDDKNLIEAFRLGEDIHTKTASQVFHVPKEEVTSTMRGRAKAVNFGIVYGISDYGLSRDLNIPRKESKQYIENYLKFFSGVKKYMDDIISKGKKDGYVETILGRRRYIPELSSRNFNIRAFGERLALNTPVQGTAADIIKKAMINVDHELSKRNMKSRLILQVHDELIVEAYKDEVEEVKKMLKEAMENAVQLKVPVVVDLNIGDTWYDTK
ncbi:MAG: DNA polymerase I [Clostridiales bacterium 38_11]|nr:MAG: DNA polymerase I [Clostridiales bacterium 38_11]HBH12509.1 DNA polymerase I [Clostridiales bacterium]